MDKTPLSRINPQIFKDRLIERIQNDKYLVESKTDSNGLPYTVIIFKSEPIDSKNDTGAFYFASVGNKETRNDTIEVLFSQILLKLHDLVALCGSMDDSRRAIRILTDVESAWALFMETFVRSKKA